jgi:hypothetical protein
MWPGRSVRSRLPRPRRRRQPRPSGQRRPRAASRPRPVRTADRPEFYVGPSGRAEPEAAAVILGGVWIVETPPFLIELPADDPDRARRFLGELLGRRSSRGARARPSSKEVADMPESGLPIRVYKEHDTWHVDYGEGVINQRSSGPAFSGGRDGGRSQWSELCSSSRSGGTAWTRRPEKARLPAFRCSVLP